MGSIRLYKGHKVKRRPNDHDEGLEPWLDWHIRSYSRAKQAIAQHNIDIEAMVQNLRLSWAGHIARMGLPGKEIHLIKLVCAWRNRWWEEEQRLFNSMNWDAIKHPADMGPPRRWENDFSTNWMLVLSKPQT